MTAAFGAYGKMPSMGDFFRLNVAQGFVAAWDAWLQAAMQAAQGRLGEDWEDRYMSAPIWRFALGSGVAGPSAVVGVMMPSVDRVGRKFPLTLVAPVPEAPPLRWLALQDAVFARLEDIALDALDDAATQATLAEALAEVSPAHPLPPSRVIGSAAGFLIASPAPEALLPDLALRFGPDPAAVFSTALEGGACLIAGAGLPDPDYAEALFDLGAQLWKEGGP